MVRVLRACVRVPSSLLALYFQEGPGSCFPVITAPSCCWASSSSLMLKLRTCVLAAGLVTMAFRRPRCDCVYCSDASTG